MYNSLLEKINSSQILNEEDIQNLNSLSEDEIKELKNLYHEKCVETYDLNLLNYFLDAYAYLITEHPEIKTESMIKNSVKKLTPESFHKSYRNHIDPTLNELMVVIIQREDEYPEDVRNEVLDRLFEKNIGLIGTTLRRFSNKNDGKITMEDLGQEARVSLLKAIKKYDITRKNRFSTFAMTVIHHAIVGFLQQKVNKMRALEISTETIIADDGGATKTLLDYQEDPNPNPEETYMTNVRNEIIYEVLNRLTSDQKFVAYCRFGLGGVPKKTQAEIADYMHMSQANVSKIESNMLKALKKELAKEGLF